MPSGGGGSPIVGVSSRSKPDSNQAGDHARDEPGAGPTAVRYCGRGPAPALLGQRPGERLDVVGGRSRGRATIPSWSSVAAWPAAHLVRKVSARSNVLEPARVSCSSTVCPSDSSSSRGVAAASATTCVRLGRPARLGQQPDAQLARVGAELLRVRARGRRGDVRIARRRPVDRLEDRRRVADRLCDTTSSTVRPDMLSPMIGPSEMRCRVGLRPTRPHSLAGMRIEPPPSLACATGTMPEATAAPDPPLEPPVERCEVPGVAASARTPSARSSAGSRARGCSSCRS